MREGRMILTKWIMCIKSAYKHSMAWRGKEFGIGSFDQTLHDVV